MSLDYYSKKVIYTYTKIEEFVYQAPIVLHKERKRKTKKIKYKKKTKYNLNQTKHKIRRLVYANPDLNKFLTLTFAEHITDLDQANQKLKSFIQRLNYYYESVRYIAVPEFTKIGRVHYHLLLNLPYIPQKHLQDVWGQGIVHIKRVDKISNLGLYISKYISKFNGLEEYKGKKKYFTSKNLTKPVIYYDNESQEFLDIIKKEEEYKNEYNTPFHGKVNYTSYKT